MEIQTLQQKIKETIDAIVFLEDLSYFTIKRFIRRMLESMDIPCPESESHDGISLYVNQNTVKIQARGLDYLLEGEGNRIRKHFKYDGDIEKLKEGLLWGFLEMRRLNGLKRLPSEYRQYRDMIKSVRTVWPEAEIYSNIPNRLMKDIHRALQSGKSPEEIYDFYRISLNTVKARHAKDMIADAFDRKSLWFTPEVQKLYGYGLAGERKSPMEIYKEVKSQK
jgi:hypothetical protein